jgi:hypothetical protein
LELLQYGESPLPPRINSIQSGERLRRAAREKAEAAGLRVPWPRLLKAAISYSEWQVFALRVRSACEPSERIPSALVNELHAKCPGFLEWNLDQQRQDPAGHSVWRNLVEWIATSYFAAARSEGWYEAVVHYGFNRIECLSAWSEWTHSNLGAPTGIPKLPGTPAPPSAVDALLDARALLLWTAACAHAKAQLSQQVRAELARHPRGLDPQRYSPWNRSAFVRLALDLGKPLTREARAQGSLSNLWHQLHHHPRYHRLIHFSLHCQSEWRNVRPRPSPTFDQWMLACDEYFVLRPSRP